VRETAGSRSESYRHPNVTEDEAQGVSAFRRELDFLLKNEQASEVEHEQIIAEPDEASRLYQIVALKTSLTIPYTSVWMQLDYGIGRMRLRNDGDIPCK